MTRSEMITVLRVGMNADDVEFIQIENKLDAFQKSVGGYIELAFLPELSDHSLLMICNEEGLIHGLHVNENLLPFFYVGDVLIVANGENEEFDTMTDVQKAFAACWIARLSEIQ